MTWLCPHCFSNWILGVVSTFAQMKFTVGLGPIYLLTQNESAPVHTSAQSHKK